MLVFHHRLKCLVGGLYGFVSSYSAQITIHGMDSGKNLLEGFAVFISVYDIIMLASSYSGSNKALSSSKREIFGSDIIWIDFLQSVTNFHQQKQILKLRCNSKFEISELRSDVTALLKRAEF